MGGIALAFAVLEVSSSPSALGIVLAAHSIPMVLFLLLGGVIADRFGRTLVIQVCNVARGVTQLAIAALVLTGTAELWQLAALSALNGAAMAMSFPALASVMPQLVPRDQLQPANVLMPMQRSALTVLGPTVGGILVVTVGAGWAVAVDGATYLVAAAAPAAGQDPAAAATRGRARHGRRPARGLALLRGTTWLWVIVAAFGVLNALSQRRSTPSARCWPETTIGEAGWGLILSAGRWACC